MRSVEYGVDPFTVKNPDFAHPKYGRLRPRLPVGVRLQDIPERQRPFINDSGLVLIRRGNGAFVAYHSGIESAIRATEHIPESDSQRRRQKLQTSGEGMPTSDFLTLRREVMDVHTQVQSKHVLLGKLLRDVRTEIRESIQGASLDLETLRGASAEQAAQQMNQLSRRLRDVANIIPYNQIPSRLEFYILHLETAGIDPDEAVSQLETEIEELLKNTPIHPNEKQAA